MGYFDICPKIQRKCYVISCSKGLNASTQVRTSNLYFQYLKLYKHTLKLLVSSRNNYLVGLQYILQSEHKFDPKKSKYKYNNSRKGVKYEFLSMFNSSDYLISLKNQTVISILIFNNQNYNLQTIYSVFMKMNYLYCS